MGGKAVMGFLHLCFRGVLVSLLQRLSLGLVCALFGTSDVSSEPPACRLRFCCSKLYVERTRLYAHDCGNHLHL